MKRIFITCLTLLALIASVSGVVYQNIAVETEGYELCLNNKTNCGTSINKTIKQDDILYLKYSDYDLRENTVDRFSEFLQFISPLLVFLAVLILFYGAYHVQKRSVFG